MRETVAARRERLTKRRALLAFSVGAAVSVAANVIASEPTVLGRAVSAWPALALMIAIELLQHAGRRPVVRVAMAAIVVVAAWVSYWHMVEVALMAGESTISAHILPVTVDAMMFLAAVVLTTKPKPARRKRRPAARRQPVKLRPVREA